MGRRGRRSLWLLMVLLVIGSAAATAWHWRASLFGDTSPKAVLLPPKSTGTAVRDYMIGAGAPLTQLLLATESLPATSDAASCETLSQQLDFLGTPGDFLNISNSVPDPNVRDASVNHVFSVTNYLSVCGGRGNIASAAEDANFTGVVLRRILEEEGAIS